MEINAFYALDTSTCVGFMIRGKQKNTSYAESLSLQGTLLP